MVEKRAQRLTFGRALRQSGQLRLGVRKQAVERLLQFTRRRPERRRLTLAAGIVMFQPLPVQSEDFCDPPDPSLAPLRELFLAGGGLDVIATLMAPAVSQNRDVSEKANEALIRSVAIADDDRAGTSFGEQLEC